MTSTDELKRLLAEATPLPWEYASDKLAAGNIKAMWNARLICAAVNALPELLALREEVGRLREAFSGPAAWLDSWAQHVGNCKGGYVCTCGLTLARTEAAAALKEPTP